MFDQFGHLPGVTGLFMASLYSFTIRLVCVRSLCVLNCKTYISSICNFSIRCLNKVFQNLFVVSLGILFYCLFLASYSTLSSALNSLAAVFLEDIVKSCNPTVTEPIQTKVSKAVGMCFLKMFLIVYSISFNQNMKSGIGITIFMFS